MHAASIRAQQAAPLQMWFVFNSLRFDKSEMAETASRLAVALVSSIGHGSASFQLAGQAFVPDLDNASRNGRARARLEAGATGCVQTTKMKKVRNEPNFGLFLTSSIF